VTIDDVPIWLLFVGTTLLIVGAIEVGYRIGRTAHRKSEDEKEAPVSAITGTVLALLAFILAFTFGIVSDRYDARKALVREEANAIRTAYTRADFLPEPSRDEAKALFGDYVELVIESADPDNLDRLPALIADARAIQRQLWDMAVANVRAGDNSDISASYVDSLNEMSNVLATRVAVAVQSRIPTGIWVVLYALIALGMVAVGYQTAIAASRRSWAMVVLALSFSIVITMIAALDNPERGYLPVSQRPLVDAQVEMK
jgi:hypothetical protein